MTLPAVFGSSWDQFIQVWCCGTSPPWLVPETVEYALDTLARLWPELTHRITTPSQKGVGVAPALSVVAEAVAQGLALAACESLEGFGEVLTQLKNDSKQNTKHYSELVLAQKISVASYLGTPKYEATPNYALCRPSSFPVLERFGFVSPMATTQATMTISIPNLSLVVLIGPAGLAKPRSPASTSF
jgi:hypothetical protein